MPHLGRDADGNDIDELTGYSSTLVDRVRDTGEALVVTGSEEGVALGSRSALVHGLRSIMIAPLLLDGRLLGVVYLDSRVAKGIFTADDVDILDAITNHVAVSLETARAAQLEVAVQAARRQRDVAETLRAAMAELSATLDPDEVLRRLLQALDPDAARRRGGAARAATATGWWSRAAHGAGGGRRRARRRRRRRPLLDARRRRRSGRGGRPGSRPPFGALLGAPRELAGDPARRARRAARHPAGRRQPATTHTPRRRSRSPRRWPARA